MVDVVGATLERYCADWAAKEPRFWTLSAAQHVEELALSASLALVFFAASLTASRGAHPSSKALLHTPSLVETALGAFLVAMHLINFVNKYNIQAMPLSRALLELLILPCHVYTSLGAFCLLHASRETRVIISNLLLYCAWMPLLALAFPDLDSARALSSPLLRQGSILLFYLHHCALLAVPVLLHWRQTLGDRHAMQPALIGLVQYLAFVYSFVGVLLCSAALLVGRKYVLSPPSSSDPECTPAATPWALSRLPI